MIVYRNLFSVADFRLLPMRVCAYHRMRLKQKSGFKCMWH